MGGIKAHMEGELERLDAHGIQVLRLNLPYRGPIVRLIPFGDLHMGHRNCMVDKAKRFIQYIRSTPGAYVILMGDLMENAILSSMQKYPGSQWEQTLTPTEQLDMAYEMLKPIRKRILFGLGGNHSQRTYKQAGLEPEEQLARRLGYPFFAADCVASLKVGQQTYVVHATHGTGSTGNPGSVLTKIIAQEKRFAGADIYLRAHHHQKTAAPAYTYDARIGGFRKIYYVGTGCFLGYAGSYAQHKEYVPTAPGAVKIKLYRDKFDIHVTL